MVEEPAGRRSQGAQKMGQQFQSLSLVLYIPERLLCWTDLTVSFYVRGVVSSHPFLRRFDGCIAPITSGRG